MSNDIKQLWYASYGSNILESRFHCYILGGQPKGSHKTQVGCTDKTMPLDKKEIYINHELYFAKESKAWGNGGVGFIDPNRNKQVQTLGRMYLITTDQFIEIVKQENNYKGNLHIDFNQLIKSGSRMIDHESWYGNLLYLGDKEGKPILTFTNEKYLNEAVNPPSKEYLLTIINGLKETYSLNNSQIEQYFKHLSGIKGTEIEKELKGLMQLK